MLQLYLAVGSLRGALPVWFLKINSYQKGQRVLKEAWKQQQMLPDLAGCIFWRSVGKLALGEPTLASWGCAFLQVARLLAACIQHCCRAAHCPELGSYMPQGPAPSFSCFMALLEAAVVRGCGAGPPAPWQPGLMGPQSPPRCLLPVLAFVLPSPSASPPTAREGSLWL